MNRTITVLLAALIAGFVACELTPEQPFTPQLVVHARLQSGNGVVRVLVNRSYRLEESYNPEFTGAQVRIFSREDTMDFEYVAGDSYQTRGPVPVAEQDTWFLEVAKPGFDTVRGRTILPAGFEIVFPRAGDTVTVRDSMVWSRSRGSKGYYLSFRQIAAQDTFYIDALIPNDSFDVSYDSLFVRIPDMLFLMLVAPPPDSPPALCTLRVWALDTNYYDWVSGAAGMNPLKPGRLSGGLGVFGSAVERLVPVWVLPDTGASLRTGR